MNEILTEEQVKILQAPYAYFGGKRRVAHLVWPRLGNVSVYIEPFFGSGAMLLNRPFPPQTETANDMDCMISNFFRSIIHEPEATADFADYPVNEADLHARHMWLVHQSEFRERMKVDPTFYDPKIAGWWVWGMSLWLAGGWCHHDAISKKTGLMGRSIPKIGSGGQGIHASRIQDGPDGVQGYFMQLAKRLRRVQVACGDWSRVVSPVMLSGNPTAIFLDPPYFDGLSDGLYAHSDANVSADVRRWAIENGDDPKLRIAICGYEGEHKMPDSWETVEWKAVGGFGNQREDGSNKNAERERIWFSPHCLKVTDTLFADYEDE